MKRLAQLILFICLPFVLKGQEYKFDHINLETGLQENGVFSLHQDQKGFLWMGTCIGLARYDGRTIKTYYRDVTGLHDLGAACIYYFDENTEGNLWLATYNGIYFFDTAKEELHHFQHQKTMTGKQLEDMILFVNEDQNGQLWFIDYAEKLFRVDLTTGLLTAFDSSGIVPAFFKDHQISIRRMTLDFQPAFLEDSAGHIWIGSRENGLLKYEPKTDQFTHYLHDPKRSGSISSNQIINIFEDKEHNIWVGTQAGLNLWDEQAERFQVSMLETPEIKEVSPSPSWVNLQDRQGDLWIASRGQMFQFTPASGKTVVYPIVDKQHFVVPLHEGDDGSFWAMDWNKEGNSAILQEVNRGTKQFIPYFSDKDDPTAVHSGIGFTQTLADRSGVFWIGSFREGVNKLDLSARKFYSYHPKGGQYLTFRPAAAEIAKGNTANIIINIDDKGVLWLVDGANLTWVRLHCTDHKGDIWISNNTEAFDKNGLGVSRLDLSNQTYTTFFTPADRKAVPCGSSANAMLVDRSGKIWVGFWDYYTDAPGGLASFDPQTQEIQCFQPDPNDGSSLVHESIGDLWEDKEGNIWIGFQGSNLALQKFDPRNGAFTIYEEVGRTTWAIEEDREGKMWIGTIMDGLILFDPVQGSIINSYQTKEGLANISVQDIVVDEENNLWLRTEFGISRFNQANETFENFTTADGLATNRSNGNHLAFRSKDGEIFIASPSQRGQTDLIYFSPKNIQKNPYPPAVSFVGFKIFNEEVTIGPKSPLQQSISATKKITLAHHQNSFTLEFAALHFNRPNENEFAFKLEPFQNEWVYNGTQNNATYTNLDPGNYTFKVKAANYDGVWNEEGSEISIVILPPWWQTWWAYTLYLLAMIGLVIGVRQYDLRRLRAKAEAERLSELDQLKSRLYTNITHEFRTPLTVIQGMADQIEGNADAKKLILRNSKSLLRLVTQMLEMAKVEAGKLKLDLIQNDIIPFLSYLTESFQSYAATKNIHLSFSTEFEELVMDYDVEKIQHVMYNLLSNAIKFTPRGGSVWVVVGGQLSLLTLLQIKIKDNGIGVSEKDLSHIFDRFYQVEENEKSTGTGIGLALTKELVKLMGGNISVHSEINQGTEFTVQLPITNLAQQQPSGLSAVALINVSSNDRQSTRSTVRQSADQPLLLIIEDNADVVIYIQELLRKDYQIQVAYNGAEGIEKALDLIPDIIISDVMMPEKDGYEVTQVLKNDIRTSHIPIILLTAKADVDSKIEGLERGADAYLAKPFNKKELLIRLQKLIEVRKKMQEQFAKLLPKDAPSDQTLKLEDIFLKKVRTIVESHITETEFNVNSLCREIGMSQPQLYRKVKALTNKSIASFIRTIRLHKGRELLQTTSATVSEVAYDVGYSDPSYFSKTFSQEFGYPPSEITTRE